MRKINSSFGNGQSYFFNNRAQLCLVFRTLCKKEKYTLKRLANTETFSTMGIERFVS